MRKKNNQPKKRKRKKERERDGKVFQKLQSKISLLELVQENEIGGGEEKKRKKTRERERKEDNALFSTLSRSNHR